MADYNESMMRTPVDRARSRGFTLIEIMVAITRVGLGVATPAGTATREYRLGGDRPSMRIRAATLLLDHVRRAFPH